MFGVYDFILRVAVRWADGKCSLSDESLNYWKDQSILVSFNEWFYEVVVPEELVN